MSSQQDEAATRGQVPSERESDERGTTDRETSTPQGGTPQAGQPVASQSQAGQPGVSQPQAGPPDGARPGAGQPAPRQLTAAAGPAGQVKPAGPDVQKPGKVTADGKILYSRLTPFVLWWTWVAFAVFCLADVVFPAHSYFSIEFAAGLLAVTAGIYASTLRPRVIADDEAVAVHNPFRDHKVSWGGVRGVFYGDSVELTCARPAGKKDKTIYCWALYTARRPRMRAEMQRSMLRIGRSATLRNPAKDIQRTDTVQLMAAELGRRCKDARERGVPEAVLESRWAWRPLAVTLALVAATMVLILAR
ncbi:MAG: hypothetical protein ACLQFR_21080 [Streptosporangiaceae bacterium]